MSAEKPAVEKVGPVQVEGTAGEVQLALPPKPGEPILIKWDFEKVGF